jgi:hypothetical protein
MKRLVQAVLVVTLLFTGCASNYRTDITREEIIAAYEAKGYIVWTNAYDEKLDNGSVAYVQANHPDGDYIYFSFFETEEDAKVYKDQYYHPAMMGLFTVIFGDPSWTRWDVYGRIVVEYDEPDFIKPFEELLKGN